MVYGDSLSRETRESLEAIAIYAQTLPGDLKENFLGVYHKVANKDEITVKAVQQHYVGTCPVCGLRCKQCKGVGTLDYPGIRVSCFYCHGTTPPKPEDILPPVSMKTNKNCSWCAQEIDVNNNCACNRWGAR